MCNSTREERVQECSSCEGKGTHLDGFDDQWGNTIEFEVECHSCDGTGEIREFKLICKSCGTEDWATVGFEVDECIPCSIKTLFNEED